MDTFHWCAYEGINKGVGCWGMSRVDELLVLSMRRGDSGDTSQPECRTSLPSASLEFLEPLLPDRWISVTRNIAGPSMLSASNCAAVKKPRCTWANAHGLLATSGSRVGSDSGVTGACSINSFLPLGRLASVKASYRSPVAVRASYLSRSLSTWMTW